MDSVLPPQVELVQDKWYVPTVYVLGTLMYFAFGGIATFFAVRNKNNLTQDLYTFITARKS